MIDASILVEILRTPGFAEQVSATIGEPDLRAPDLLNLEVLQALRRLERRGELGTHRVVESVRLLESAPIDRVPTLPLVSAAWAMRANLTPYDASYVALAEADECPLITCDRRLARSPNLPVEVIQFTP